MDIHTRRCLSLGTLAIVLACGLAAAGLGLTAYAQTTGATISDPVGPVPDPTHVPFVLPKDIKWNGTEGVQQTAILYGDPSKPGPYTLVYRWFPGHFSRPHFHDQPRWAYIVSGTWWVSSSNVYDERTTYPLHAGTFTIDVANTVAQIRSPTRTRPIRILRVCPAYNVTVFQGVRRSLWTFIHADV